jgi:hypothetical protein
MYACITGSKLVGLKVNRAEHLHHHAGSLIVYVPVVA